MVTEEVDDDDDVAVAGAVDVALGLRVLKIVYASLSPGTDEVVTIAGPIVTLVSLLEADVQSSSVDGDFVSCCLPDDPFNWDDPLDWDDPFD